MPLIPLSRNPDHALPSDAIDVRGWTVKTSLDREKVGKVEDVLLDERGRLRYLDVDLGMFSKHVLLPLSNAHVDGSQDVVWVDGLSKDHLKAIPEYKHDAKALTPAYEQRLEEDYRMAASGETREAPVVDGEPSNRQGRLARLGALEQYRVAAKDADPRGWQVVTGDGQRIGKVDELIIDTVDMQARYIDCDVAEDKLELEPLDRHILIPTDHTRLDRGKKRVIVDGIFSSDLARYPVYGGLPLDSDVERTIEAAYDRAPETRVVETRIDPTDEDDSANRFYRMRRRRTQDLEDDRIEPIPTEERARIVASDRADISEDRVQDTLLDGPDQEIRIRVSGRDIVIEKRTAD